MLQESFDTTFEKEGLVAMVNTGNHENGSAFFITLDDFSHLNHKAVVVGEVVEGLENVLALSQLGRPNGVLTESVVIGEAGEV